MKHLVLMFVLSASPGLAGELAVPLGGRAPVRPGRAVTTLVVRDPSMLKVVLSDGAAALEGVKGGVTGVKVTFADGEVEHVLVVVGVGQNSKGPRREPAQTVELTALRGATARSTRPPAVGPLTPRRRAAQAAYDVVRAAVEAL